MNHRMQPWSKPADRAARRTLRRWCGDLETLDRRELLTTFTVIDAGSDATTPGTLAWAITQANLDTTPDTIDFQLSGVAPYKITLNQALPDITAPVTIDGTTQPGYDVLNPVPVVQVTGDYIGTVNTNPPFEYTPDPNISGFVINTGNTDPNLAATTIKGLSIGNFTGSGIDIRTSNNVVIQGNNIGSDSTGLIATPNCSAGVVALDSNNIVIGGTTLTTRNVISGNDSSGIVLINVVGGTIQGNRIGVDRTGLVAMPNGQDGVNLTNTSGMLIGVQTTTSANPGSLPAAGAGSPGEFLTDPDGQNIIAANGRDGVMIWGPYDASGIPPATIVNKVLNNKIGFIVPVPSGQDLNLGNGRNGVNIGNYASGNLIQQNLIEGNLDTGVVVATGNYNALLANEYYQNTNLGIDLGYNGSTPNDFLDSDLGANFNLNYPTITSALSDATKTTITGTYSGEPSKTINIQVYTNPASLSLAPAQGKSYLGYITVTTDTSGVANFTFVTTYPLAINEKVTTVASDMNGNTSEISNFLQVQAAPTDVAITLTESASSVPVNGSVTFTAVATNQGTNTATDVVITMVVPVGFNITGTDPAGVPYPNNVVTYSIPQIAVGSSATLVVTATATTIGNYTVGASVTLTETDIQPANNQTSVSLNVTATTSSTGSGSGSGSGSSTGTGSGGSTGTGSGGSTGSGSSTGTGSGTGSSTGTTTSLVGPDVTSVNRVRLNGRTYIQLKFNQALDTASATNASNYYFITPGRNRRFDSVATGDDRVYGATSAIYNAATNTVLLTPYSPRGVDMRRLRVSVLGVTQTSVKNTGGAFLDGQNIGSPSNFTGDVPVKTQVIYPTARARAARRFR